jgi:hypothetical protein
MCSLCMMDDEVITHLLVKNNYVREGPRERKTYECWMRIQLIQIVGKYK